MLVWLIIHNHKGIYQGRILGEDYWTKTHRGKMYDHVVCFTDETDADNCITYLLKNDNNVRKKGIQSENTNYIFEHKCVENGLDGWCLVDSVNHN